MSSIEETQEKLWNLGKELVSDPDVMATGRRVLELGPKIAHIIENLRELALKGKKSPESDELSKTADRLIESLLNYLDEIGFNAILTKYIDRINKDFDFGKEWESMLGWWVIKQLELAGFTKNDMQMHMMEIETDKDVFVDIWKEAGSFSALIRPRKSPLPWKKILDGVAAGGSLVGGGLACAGTLGFACAGTVGMGISGAAMASQSFPPEEKKRSRRKKKRS